MAVIIATPWGIGLSPDSTVYIGGARSLLRGAGFSLPTDSGTLAPVVHFPPLYSFVLAMLSVTGAEPLLVARWLAAGLFACNAVLAGALGFSVLHSVRLSIIVGLFALIAFPMVQVHTMAWSEPLFIALQLGGVLALLVFFRKRSRRDLILTAVVFGCSALVRYAGLATLVAGVAGIVLLSERRWRDRLIDATIFAAIGFLLTIAWGVRNLWAAKSFVDRTFSFHPISGEQMASVFGIVSSWLSFSWLTSMDTLSISLIMLILLGAVCLLLSGSAQVPPQEWLVPSVKFLLIVTCSYLMMLMGSVSFLDAQVPVDTRLLSPLYVLLLVVGLSLGASLWRDSRVSGVSRAILALSLMTALAAQAAASIGWLEFSIRDGVGYAGREWRNSETLVKLASLPPANRIYSNAPDALYVLRGTPAAMIPRKVDPQTSRPNPHYAMEMAQLRRALNEDKAILAYFNRITWRWYLPTAGEVEEAIGMRPWARASDGLIFAGY